MNFKITKKEISALNKILKTAVNDISNIYKYEGYIVGFICSEDITPMSVLMEDLFGSSDKHEWNSLDDVNLFMDIYKKINNKSVNKLKSHIYRPIFAKSEAELSDYAFGFLKAFTNSLVETNEDMGLEYAIVCAIYKLDRDLIDTDSEYVKFVNTILEKPLINLSLAIRNINNIRKMDFLDENTVEKSNIIDFNSNNGTIH